MAALPSSDVVVEMRNRIAKNEAAMASNWEKPGFELVMVSGECTAYAGSQIAKQPPAVEPGLVAVTGETVSERNQSLPNISILDEGNDRPA
jgi:hypothetical protein